LNYIRNAMKKTLLNLMLCAALVPLSAQVSDIDGNSYTTVTIGNQVWMAENLRVGRLNDGTPLNLISDGETWKSTPTPAACWYNNDSAQYHLSHGRMYNGFAALSSAICPTGWKVPSDVEWGDMIRALGGSSIAGGKMKDTGLTYWDSPNTGATNSSGFTGRPGGYRSPIDGSFSFIRQRGGWFVTQRGTSVSFQFLSWSLESSGAGAIDNYAGLSIRCLRELPASVNAMKSVLSVASYPNPASQKVRVEWGSVLNAAGIRVSSMDGRTILEEPCPDSRSAEIDISMLPAGVYMVSITENGAAKGNTRLVVY
jgi:uncharacterized protein (TIGR02145 family)